MTERTQDPSVTPWKVAGWALRALFWVAVVALPVAGVWLASSLAVYLSGPFWLACLAGFLFFPLGPVAWEAWSRWRTRDRDIRRYLTTGDRVLLRTLAVNLIWVTGLLVAFPRASFEALCTHGDWMLEGRSGRSVETIRSGLLGAAAGLEFLYDAADTDPFAAWAVPNRGPGPRPAPSHKARGEHRGDGPRVPGRPPVFPMDPEMHPAMVDVPKEAEQSIAALALYVRHNESDPFLQMKALHDWVAHNIYYDYPALESGIPNQSAERVFQTRRGVCAGYTRLMIALGKELGFDIRYVRGKARNPEGGIGTVGHAWNAVFIEGNWYLMDVTWDSPRGIGKLKSGEKPIKSAYLFTPPEYFGVRHFPNDPKWQLRKAPLSRPEYTRQPILEPAFFAAGLELLSPNKAHVTSGRTLRVRIQNPEGRNVRASLREGPRTYHLCGASSATTVELECTIPRPGKYQLRFYERGPESKGRLHSAGRVSVDARF